AEALDEYGNIVENQTSFFDWENTTIQGRFNEETVGVYRVTATYAGITSSPTNITVVPEEEVYAVILLPSEDVDVPAGVELQFGAEAQDQYGNMINDNITEFHWQGADIGLFYQEIAGVYYVNASYEGVVSDDVPVTVLPSDVQRVHIDPDTNQNVTAGETIHFSAIAYDEFDNMVSEDNSDFTWQNADETGVFDITTAGEYEVIATHGDVTSPPTNVTVLPAHVNRIEINPDTHQTTVAGEDLFFTAKAYDEYDNLAPVDEFEWLGADENGIFNRIDVGDYEVSVRYGTIASSIVSVTVVPAEVYLVVINPGNKETIIAGNTVNFSAAAYDEFDNLIEDNNQEFTWDNADETGIFYETNAGEYDVTAAYGDVTSDPTVVIVQPAEEDYVTISPSEDQSIEAGTELQLTARAYDAYDNLLVDDPTYFTWQNTDVTGRFRETTVGEYNVWARYLGIYSPTITVTVMPLDVYIVEITPTTDQTIVAGDTVDFSAAAYDEYHNLITDGNEHFDWVNTDNDGVFVETNVGEYYITASYGDTTSESTKVTVSPGATNYIVIHPEATVTATAGEDVEFFAEAYDLYDNLVIDDVVEFTWRGTNDVGIFNEEAAGEYSVTASYMGITSDPTVVTLEPAEAHRVNITPSDDQIVHIGVDLQFNVEAYDAYDNLITDTATDFEWENTDTNGTFNKGEIGSYQITAAYENITSDTVTVTVGRSYFEIRIIGYDREVQEGDKVVIEYNVNNTGDMEGTKNIVLWVNGEKVKVQSELKLEPGKSYTGEFSWKTEEVGDFFFKLDSGDTIDTGEVTVESKPLIRMRPMVGIIGVILFILLVSIIILLARRREAAETVEDEYVHEPVVEEDIASEEDRSSKLASYKEDLKLLNSKVNEKIHEGK
ncbi:MAG: hypothetical protein R6U17_05245, partial [Thermoplasmata archaeon]